MPIRKPSQELLRRAREHSEETGSGIPPVEAATKWRNHPWTAEDIVRTADEVVMSKAVFAEQIVRECAEIARTTGSVGTEPSGMYEEGYMSGCNRTQAKILRKFGLKE